MSAMGEGTPFRARFGTARRRRRASAGATSRTAPSRRKIWRTGLFGQAAGLRRRPSRRHGAATTTSGPSLNLARAKPSPGSSTPAGHRSAAKGAVCRPIPGVSWARPVADIGSDASAVTGKCSRQHEERLARMIQDTPCSRRVCPRRKGRPCDLHRQTPGLLHRPFSRRWLEAIAAHVRRAAWVSQNCVANLIVSPQHVSESSETITG